MRRIFLPALALLLAAGCLGAGPVPSSGDPADATRYVRAETWLWANATGPARLDGDFGPHCADVVHLEDQGKVLVWAHVEGDLSRLVHQRGMPGGRGDGLNPSTGSAQRLVLPDDGGVARLASLVDEDVPLLDVRFDGDSVVVGEERLGAGARSAPFRHEKTYATPEGEVHVTELVVVHHVGLLPLVREEQAGCM